MPNNLSCSFKSFKYSILGSFPNHNYKYNPNPNKGSGVFAKPKVTLKMLKDSGDILAQSSGRYLKKLFF